MGMKPRSRKTVRKTAKTNDPEQQIALLTKKLQRREAWLVQLNETVNGAREQRDEFINKFNELSSKSRIRFDELVEEIHRLRDMTKRLAEIQVERDAAFEEIDGLKNDQDLSTLMIHMLSGRLIVGK